MQEQESAFNGINAATGDYLFTPTDKDIKDVAMRQLAGISEIHDPKVIDTKPSAKKQLYQSLKIRKENKESHMGVAEGIEARNLSQTGWGIIFAEEDPLATEIYDALKKLRDHRSKQVKHKEFYKEFLGKFGYWRGDSAVSFLSRHGGSPIAVNPRDGVPYYLLVIGDPYTIPYEFQYQLDVQYAVGRLSFEGNSKNEILDQYENYANMVVEVETNLVYRNQPRKATFFGVRNDNDRATMLSCDKLIAPLSDVMTTDQQNKGWKINTIKAEEATRNRLEKLVVGEETPTFLFTASHGIAFPPNHPNQIAQQGSLLCSDWPGPSWREPIPESFYLAGDHISKKATPQGLIAFFFACYGAGTPRTNDFIHHDFEEVPKIIAPQPFIANLPNQLLAKGVALAVVGHVDRAWGNSFLGKADKPEIQTFQNTLKRLLEGHPVGSAMEYFNQYYATEATKLTKEIFAVHEVEGIYNPPGLDHNLARLWTNHQDARNYLVIGDPAVRLPMFSQDEYDTTLPPPSKQTQESSQSISHIVKWQERLEDIEQDIQQVMSEIERIEETYS